ncbi:MAG: hemolysin III family protein [Actinomycetota bacterium]|nr:hemolysin III family protein [Actinomycetota bacterium]
MNLPIPRWTLGKMQNPVRGFLHGAAAVAGLIGTVFLLFHAPNWPSRIAVLVFGLAVMALYTTSSLYHAIPWRVRWKKRMQRMDHSMIYVLIAGTYTPIAAIVLDTPWQWIVLAMVWSITIAGVVQKGLFPKVPGWISVMMSTILGWIGIFFFWPMIQQLGWLPIGFVLAGGVLYTIGMVFLVTNRPRLWPRVFSYHEVFHILTVSATSLHFLVIWRYVIPLAAA